MNVQKIASLRSIDRRKFMQTYAGSLALAAVGCGHDRARAKQSSITILYCCDEWQLSPYWYLPSAHLVFLPLVTQNERGEIEGRLAESWEHSADYRTWTIRLRKDVRWQDGVPVTAHDIKFTFDLLSNPDVQWFPPGVISVTVLDERTCSILYQRRVGAIPPDDYQVYYPRHLLEDLDPKKLYEWDFWIHPVGNGPYRYIRHIPKTMMEFQANPNYFGGKPRIERVLLKFGDASGSGAVTELLSGNVDAIPYVNRMDLLKIAGDPRFRVYHSTSPHNITAVFWNSRYPPFREPRVRRALTVAINRRELIQVLNLPENIPLFDVIFSERQFWRGELPEPLPYDPAQAKRLLDEVGWVQGNGGVRQRAGEALLFSVIVPSLRGTDKAAVYVQAQLQQVGIRMEIHVLELEALKRRVRAGDFEAAISPYIINSGPSQGLGPLSYFGERSPIGYSNPKVIPLLKKAQASMNPNEIDGFYRDLWPIFQNDLPATFLYPSVMTTVAHRRVRGLVGPFRTEPVAHMEDLWLEDGSQQ